MRSWYNITLTLTDLWFTVIHLSAVLLSIVIHVCCIYTTMPDIVNIKDLRSPRESYNTATNTPASVHIQSCSSTKLIQFLKWKMWPQVKDIWFCYHGYNVILVWCTQYLYMLTWQLDIHLYSLLIGHWTISPITVSRWLCRQTLCTTVTKEWWPNLSLKQWWL